MAQGVMVFTSLKSALNAGYQIYDRRPEGYLMRILTARGWAMALVNCKHD